MYVRAFAAMSWPDIRHTFYNGKGRGKNSGGEKSGDTVDSLPTESGLKTCKNGISGKKSGLKPCENGLSGKKSGLYNIKKWTLQQKKNHLRLLWA